MYIIRKTQDATVAFLLPLTAFSFSKDNVIEPWDESRVHGGDA